MPCQFLGATCLFCVCVWRCLRRCNEYMKVYRVPSALREKIRAYIIYCRALKKELGYQEVRPRLTCWRSTCLLAPGAVLLHCPTFAAGICLCPGPSRCRGAQPKQPQTRRQPPTASLKRSLLCMCARGSQVLDQLSPTLRGALSLHCYGPALQSVPFFQPNVEGLNEHEAAAVSHETEMFLQQVSIRVRAQRRC
jgi:hypothetical protein